jgi:hypothetical protein
MDSEKRLCVKCKHCNQTPVEGGSCDYFCTVNRREEIHIVTGIVALTGTFSCYYMRDEKYGKCGPEGKLWEPKL